MKIKNSLKLITLSVALSAMFVGCGSSDDTATTTATTLTGTFVDAPVQGLAYKTATQSGYTDANGQFKYVAGEEVELKLGTLSLGKGTAGALLTPYAICDNNDTATNIALLLQNFDANRSNTGALDLSKLKDYDFSDVNLSITPAAMETKIANLVSDISAHADFGASFLDANPTPINAATVKATMDTYIAETSTAYDMQFTEAYLAGKTLYQKYAISPDVGTYAFTGAKSDFSDLNNDSDTFEDTLSGYATGDGMLLVKDGKLYEFTTDTAGNYNDGINIFTITAIDDTKITTSMNGYVVYWYFNQADADNASLLDTGFTKAYLDTAVFYKTSDEYPQYMNKYINGEIFFAGDELVDSLGWDSTFNTASNTYTLVDGVMNASFGSGATFEITEVTNDYLLVTGTLGTDIREEKWYLSKAAAIANTATVQYGFGSNTLKDDTFYVPRPSGLFTMTFKNGINSILDHPDLNYAQDFTITDGMILVDESNIPTPDAAGYYGTQYYVVMSIDNEKITTCSDNDDSNSLTLLDSTGTCLSGDIIELYYNQSIAQNNL